MSGRREVFTSQGEFLAQRRRFNLVMSESNNTPPTSDALERTLSELLAAETVLDGRNGQRLQATVEKVVTDLIQDEQLKSRLMSETKVGFGMALGKFMAWKVWTEIEKSDKKRAASKSRLNSFTLRLPVQLLGAVKEAWPAVKAGFYERVGFNLAEPTLEPSDGPWCLEVRGGLLETRELPEEWFEPLLHFLVDQAPRMLTLATVKELVETAKASEPAIAEELERLRMPSTSVYRVLEGLLQEAVPIHEMEAILTAMILNWEGGADRHQLLSTVRLSLSPWICRSVQCRPGVLRALKVGRRIEEMFAESVRYLGSEQVFALEHQQRARVAVLLKQAVEKLGGVHQIVILTNHRIRQELRNLIRLEVPGVVVLSEAEIHKGFKVEVTAVVDFKEPPKESNTIRVSANDQVGLF